MAKKLHDTEIWEQDWFIELRDEYRWLFLYIKDKVDAGGIWRPNKAQFEQLIKKKIDLYDFLAEVNKDKERFVVLKNQRWLLLGYFKFQYGSTMTNSSPHKGALKSWIANDAIHHIKDVTNLHEIDIKEFVAKGFKKGSKGLETTEPKEPSSPETNFDPGITSPPVINGHDLRSTVLNTLPAPVERPAIRIKTARPEVNWAHFVMPEVEFYDDGSELSKEIETLIRKQNLTFFIMYNKINSTKQLKDIMEQFIKKVQSEQSMMASNKLLQYMVNWYKRELEKKQMASSPQEDNRNNKDNNRHDNHLTISNDSDRDYGNIKSLRIDE
jgi:hypothetical protein